MIRIRDIILPAEHDQTALLYCAAQELRVKPSDITSLQIFKRSVDARKKPDLKWVYTVDVNLRMSEKRIMKGIRNRKITIEEPYFYHIDKKASEDRPVIVGFGPAGMFAALVLARSGLRPIVLERGAAAPERKEKVDAFWSDGQLDEQSNVQFGEGGAGTFSDGKLNTGTKNVRSRWVLEQMVHFGALEEILYDAKPHVGTDVLFYLVQRLRERVISLGGEVRFGAKMTALETENDRICGVKYEHNGEEHRLSCKHVILAIGHSARDTFRMLHASGIAMEPKPFSMGVRIEHKQSLIDLSQYGTERPKGIPPADYKLSVHLPDGNSAYTFCMCPGGYVVAAASQTEGVVTNGMSYAARDGETANSALLVTLKPEDFPSKDTLGGMYWQEEIEHRAFVLGGGNYFAPSQTVGDFLAHRPSEKVSGTYRPGLMPCDLHKLYPEKITKTLEQAIVALNEKLEGFADPSAILTAPETRSSSPVRIVRGEDYQSELKGLYPCGEGAGYAGGIMSAAVDGMLCAEAIIREI
ncbi:MAG: hypothetical protein E7467_04565 [Ruminococcaceae bacterium]|nr:hypothetical protein [Oscillospiraceae bacterium]